MAGKIFGCHDSIFLNIDPIQLRISVINTFCMRQYWYKLFNSGLSPDLNLTPLAAFLRFCRAQRGSDRNFPLGVRWVRHKNVSHPNHSMSATILSTCYASTESLGVSELNDANIKSFDVPGRISRAVESTNFTTIMFTLPRMMAPKFANQLPIRNVGRTCNGSGNVWNWESRSRCTGTLVNTAPHKRHNFAAWICYPSNLRRNHQEKRWWVVKTNASKRLVCWLENSRFQFQKLLCKWSWSRDKIWPQK